MAKRLSKSNKHLDKNDIAEIFKHRQESLKMFFSELNPNFSHTFVGLTATELNEERKYHLSEVEKDACLNMLASIEAAFRLDYVIRCEKKDKADISRKFRSLYAKHLSQIPLVEGIFDEWKNIDKNKESTIYFLKEAFQYRHWLAHGRYWTLKKKEYDFYELYNIAAKVDATFALLS